jgi:23S rRNA pseudouridine1911/1915/1917 synthase
MASSTQIIQVTESWPRQRLDVYLHRLIPSVSRGAIQRLIEQGDISVDGHSVKSTHQPRAGENIQIHWPPPKASDAQPEQIPLDILFEDEELLVLNKPPGLVVHPAAGHEEHTLVNALLHYCRDSLSGIGGVLRPGIVHRLDKDTSGCLVVAKNDAAHIALATQFAQRTLRKLYQALVCGKVTPAAGDIRAAIARHPSHRKRMAVTDGGGREAWTSYRVVHHLDGASWVEAELHTGRTHQIRVHFHHIGFPLVGDPVYGHRQNTALSDRTGFKPSRQMLHASNIRFRHPRTGRDIHCEAPLPEDFRQAVAALQTPQTTP